jgi:hypothetical protein
VRQVGYSLELYRGAWSPKYEKIWSFDLRDFRLSVLSMTLTAVCDTMTHFLCKLITPSTYILAHIRNRQYAKSDI